MKCLWLTSYIILVGIQMTILSACTKTIESDTSEKIPLEQIYFTINQKGLKYISLTENLPFQEQLECFNNTLRPRAPNLFLTRAKNSSEAMEAAIRLNGPANLSLPANENDVFQLWLVAFFGRAQSSPQQWTIESVVHHQSSIKVNYTTNLNKINTRTADSVPYLAVVPLKEHKTGIYTLELFDSTNNDVMLMRKIRIQ